MDTLFGILLTLFWPVAFCILGIAAEMDKNRTSKKENIVNGKEKTEN